MKAPNETLTMFNVIQGVARTLRSEPFPRTLRWDEAGVLTDGYTFEVRSGRILIPKGQATVLQRWSLSTVDDLGRVTLPEGSVPTGYVFSMPGDCRAPISTPMLTWLRAEDRDLQKTLYCVAEGVIRSRPEINDAWYNAPLFPAAVRFLEWYREYAGYSEGTLKRMVHDHRHWMSKVGPEMIRAPEDPIAFSWAFGRAGPLRYSAERFWREQWQPWAFSEMGISVPDFPGIPGDVIDAYRELDARGEFWTPEMIERLHHDRNLSKLAVWATANGQGNEIRPRVTPILPRFAGGSVPIGRHEHALLDRPWDYGPEVAVLKARQSWWTFPRLLLSYPVGTPTSLITKGVRMLPGSSRPGAPLPTTSVTVESPSVDDGIEYVLIRVPKSIESQVVSYAEGVIRSMEVNMLPPLLSDRATEREARRPKRKPVEAAAPQARMLTADERPTAPKAPQVSKPAAAPVEPVPKPSEAPRKTPSVMIEPPASAQPVQEVTAPADLPATLAISYGWDRKTWLAVYRRKPGVPNPYEVEERTPPNHPRFKNGFKVPPEWLPRMSQIWKDTERRYPGMGTVTALDMEIPGLFDYIGEFWTEEGLTEWEKAMDGDDAIDDME